MTNADPRFDHGMLAASILRSAGFEPLARPADVYVIPDFSGSPDRMEAWLIFARRDISAKAEADRVAYLERAVAALRDGGFPADALPSFRLYFTSEDDIEERGGRFAFFR